MTRLVKQSLGREVTVMLKRMIINGEFTPNQRLVEDRLATDLGISRTPLREALHRLEQEGLLEKRVNSGYMLKPLNAAEVEDAVEIRALLESHAAALAAKRIDKAGIQALNKNFEKFQLAAANGNVTRLTELNSEFHSLIRTACGSPLLIRLLSEIEGVTERIIRALISLSEAGQWSEGDHQRIVKAIANRDADAAALAMREHVMHGGTKVLNRMRQDSFQL